MFENMSQREKILAMAVGSMLLLGLVFYGGLDFLNQYQNNKDRLKAVANQIDEENYKMEFALQANDRLGLFYEPISFPTSENQITVYQDWLEKTIRKSGLNDIAINEPKDSSLAFTTDRNTVQRIGKKYSITATAEGTLNEIVEFYYSFEQLELLQRIRQLTLLPKNDPKKAGVVRATFKIEILSLEDAAESREFLGSERKLLVALEDYKNKIIGRNIFGPANNPPTLRVSNKTVEEEEDISVSLSGRDKDSGDELTFEIVKADDFKDAKIVPGGKTRAKFVASAMPIGEYTAIVKVTDNGFPQKSEEKEFKVTVEKKPDPPEPGEPPEIPPTPPVLESPSTQINRITKDSDGLLRVKIKNRMKGENYVVAKGESFELDGKTWVIKSIEKLNVTIDVDGEILEFRIGNFLDKPRNSGPSANQKPKAESKEDLTETSVGSG